MAARSIDEAVRYFEAVFGVKDLDPDLLGLALTHRSYAYEHGGIPTNERLEFLGDTVLSVSISTLLYRNYPHLPEGQLAPMRASVVSMKALADVALRLGGDGIGPFLLLGKGEENDGGREKASILADATEALLGAVYLQYGHTVAERVVRQFFGPLIRDAAGQGAALDWKTSLQELTADHGMGVPRYWVTETGPDHAKEFTAWAEVAGEEFAEGTGSSKKDAEHRAAEKAWRALAGRLGVEDS
ncbi:ribonuclease III [Salininema proteolyticum]|uniref:Ribonuclease 3 n=1 Tax=Salininema proteolyticum TaxID=1607685 RepID=A0ABV8TY01_9ACTN